MFWWSNALVRKFCIATIVLTLGTSASGRDVSFHELQDYLDGVVASGVPGIVLQVSWEGTQWAGVAGSSNIEHQEKLLVGDSFPVFSVTKTFTAITILQLIEEGRLSFDDTLGELLRTHRQVDTIESIPYVAQVTIRQLLNHSSGIFDYANSMEYLQATVGSGADFSKEWTIEDVLSYAHEERNEPAGVPGSVFSYSSTGYLLLGLVVEELEQQSLADVYAERIFAPLKLSHTYLSSYDQWQSPDVTGYIMTNNEMRELGLGEVFPVADGNLVNASKGQRSRLGKSRGEDGAVSTAESLMVFTNALFAGDLISNELLVEFLTPQNDSADAVTNGMHNFGLGIHIVVEGDQSWALMIGNGAGGEAVVGRELESGLTFVALTNVFGAGVVDKTLEKMHSVVQGLDAT